MKILTEKTRIGWRNRVVGLLLLLFSLTAAGCGGNESILKSGKESTPQANAQPAKTSFQLDLDAVRAADFSFVYVLRRKDGGVIDAEDKSVIRLQTAQANRRVAADDGRAFIIGSNFQLPAQNIAAIYGRFAVENYSPVPTPVANGNVNANK